MRRRTFRSTLFGHMPMNRFGVALLELSHRHVLHWPKPKKPYTREFGLLYVCLLVACLASTHRFDLRRRFITHIMWDLVRKKQKVHIHRTTPWTHEQYGRLRLWGICTVHDFKHHRYVRYIPCYTEFVNLTGLTGKNTSVSVASVEDGARSSTHVPAH